MNCPDCKEGKLYEKREPKTGFTIRKCFVCGYYWNDSPAYKTNPEIDKRLFKGYFPIRRGWKASPTVGQPFTSPEHWTEPLTRFCPILSWPERLLKFG
jgi:hypothetical protein